MLPSVLAFALSGVYTIVDGFFIGQSLGDAGLAAITLAYPLSALIAAVGTGIGLAGAIRVTILDAQGEEQKRQACFGGTTLLMLLIGAVLTALLPIVGTPLLRLLGADGSTLSLCTAYARIIAIGAVFQVLSTGFVPFIRNMGSASFAMVAMILGFLTNIALDYTFIWVMERGMAGAALATILGQAMTVIAAIGFFAVKKSRPRLPARGALLPLWRGVLAVALSPFGLSFSPTVTMLLIDRFLLLYGSERSVAIYGCIGYVTSIVYLLLQGIGDGSQPLVSRHYGEGGLAAAKSVRRLAYLTAAAVTAVCLIGLLLAKSSVGVLFGASPEANVGVARYLPLFLTSLPLLAYVRITTSYLYATEKTRLSYVLVYAEPVCTLLFLLLLPPVFKLGGVWAAVPLAQAATFAAAVAAKRHTDRQAPIPAEH